MAQSRPQQRRSTGPGTQGRVGRSTSRQGEAARRFGRGGSSRQADAAGRFSSFGRGQSAPTTRIPSRPGQRQQKKGGGQGIVQQLQGALPGKGGSSQRKGPKKGKVGSIPGIGGALMSLSGNTKGSNKRSRKPALLGLIGAGAAGAAALAKKRQSGGSEDYSSPSGSDFSTSVDNVGATPSVPPVAATDTTPVSPPAQSLDTKAVDTKLDKESKDSKDKDKPLGG
jgi:hypothetical protein